MGLRRRKPTDHEFAHSISDGDDGAGDELVEFSPVMAATTSFKCCLLMATAMT